ncbi:MAG TPA: (2Fe-2S)-binding protein [Halanaerobiales bacterium]|nr:(2Fe-2S)-binding protein [Halanaerobiales bacterium]
MNNRINNHPILGKREEKEKVEIIFDGNKITAEKGEMIAAALYANGIRINRYTIKYNEPRGIFCAIGQCTDCSMVVNGIPNVRTCITPVEKGMVIETQYGLKRSGKTND